MLDAPEQDELPVEQPQQRSDRFTWLRTLQATSTRRALLLTALGGLFIAGIITALPVGGDDPNRLVGYVDADPVPSTGARGNETLNHARGGDCLNWPDRTPDAAAIVDCKDEHRFEVAESVDMRTFPGAEYGPDAAPPSTERIQQISQEQCQAAVRNYLGPRFDPNSRFTISMLWSGDKAWRQSGERRMLCGLQLPGADNQQVALKGKVADLDQSKVWPAGTCLGIEPTTNQPSDVPVDCAAPHAMEVTGAVNLAEKFPDALPAEPDQDKFIKDTCTRMTDAYLAPIQLRSTTLTLIYSTISLPSWSAGSHQIACSIGATLGNGGWATLLNSAKGPLLINGQPPIPPPAIPEERLNLPPIPLTTQQGTAVSPSQTGQSQQSQQDEQTQHLPQQQSMAPTATQTAPSTPPTAQTNTVISTPSEAPPPPPAQDAPAAGEEAPPAPPPPPGLPPGPIDPLQGA